MTLIEPIDKLKLAYEIGNITEEEYLAMLETPILPLSEEQDERLCKP